MLSQQGNHDNEQEDVYVRGYKPTDIFNLAPPANAPGKRLIVDRNRSSVFNNDSASDVYQQAAPLKNDRMKSDIFFAPATARFGQYEPSLGNSRRSSARDLYQAPSQEYHETSNFDTVLEPKQEEAHYEHENYHEENLAAATAAVNEESYREQSINDYQSNSYRNSISNVFEAQDANASLRGARRHYSQYQSTSDIFFRANEDAPTPRRKQSISSTPYEPPQWVPSVKMTGKSTSFSNIFGDAPNIDAEVRKEYPPRSPEKSFDNREKLIHTFGLSSEDMNRQRRGKGARRGTGGATQIWF